MNKAFLPLTVISAVVLAACSGVDEPVSKPAATTTPAETKQMSMVQLSADCPDPLVIQTDWFPEAEHGATYQMIGDGYTIDAENKVVRGPLVASDGHTGIDIEVRVGGPAIGWSSVNSHMYLDDSIHIGYENSETQAAGYAEAPTVSVFAPLEINPQFIMWDPYTYPDVETIADIGEQGILVNVFGGSPFADYFTGIGIWSEDQVDPSYDGSPARFIAEQGQIAQQGFMSAEPYSYENLFEEWNKPVKGQLLHDAGFEAYAGTFAVRKDRLAELDACLTKFVPVAQQAVLDYVASPMRANDIIVDATDTYNDSWVQDRGMTDWSVEQQVNLGIVGNGADNVVGNFEEMRVGRVLGQLYQAGFDVSGIQANEVFTNKYIDYRVGFTD